MKTILAHFALALCASLSSAEVTICPNDLMASKCEKNVKICHRIKLSMCCKMGCKCNKGYVYDDESEQCVKRKDCIKKGLFNFKEIGSGCQCDTNNNERSLYSSDDQAKCEFKRNPFSRKYEQEDGCICKKGYILDESDNRCVKRCYEINPSVSDDEQNLNEHSDAASGEQDKNYDDINYNKGFNKNNLNDKEISNDNRESSGDDTTGSITITGNIVSGRNGVSSNMETDQQLGLDTSEDCDFCNPNEVCIFVNNSKECQEAIDYVAKVNI